MHCFPLPSFRHFNIAIINFHLSFRFSDADILSISSISLLHFLTLMLFLFDLLFDIHFHYHGFADAIFIDYAATLLSLRHYYHAELSSSD